MIDLLSIDGCSRFLLTTDGDASFIKAYHGGILSAFCAFTHHDTRRELKTFFMRADLDNFALALESMRVNLIQNSQSTLWSNDGRVIFTLVVMSLGRIRCNCLLSQGTLDEEVEVKTQPLLKEYGLLDEDDYRETIRLFGRFEIDQSFLPTLVAEVRQLSTRYDDTA